MKKLPTVVLAVAVGALLWAGCGNKSDSSAKSTNSEPDYANGNPLTAPVDYLGAVGQAQQRAVKTIDTISLDSAVKQFYAAEERFPKDLKELVTKGYIREIPNPPNGTKINYDPATGAVKLVKQ
jgi:hypothetical protein